MADDAEWGLVEPFDTDNGELDGVPPAECFALGVEFEMFRQKLKTGLVFKEHCLANNAERLVRMVERHNRFVEHSPAETEGWALIHVGGTK